MDRRNFIKKLGIGVGVATVAPSLLLSLKQSAGVRELILTTPMLPDASFRWIDYQQYEYLKRFKLGLEEQFWKNNVLFMDAEKFPLTALVKDVRTNDIKYKWNVRK